ncbi:hypothetical protein ONZ45_g11511 [Pleurotus djamor]|nr:hypothetical protein ONZ45_g11511 [Pleurotus djamor]
MGAHTGRYVVLGLVSALSIIVIGLDGNFTDVTNAPYKMAGLTPPVSAFSVAGLLTSTLTLLLALIMLCSPSSWIISKIGFQLFLFVVLWILWHITSAISIISLSLVPEICAIPTPLATKVCGEIYGVIVISIVNGLLCLVYVCILRYKKRLYNCAWSDSVQKLSPVHSSTKTTQYNLKGVV